MSSQLVNLSPIDYNIPTVRIWLALSCALLSYQQIVAMHFWGFRNVKHGKYCRCKIQNMRCFNFRIQLQGFTGNKQEAIGTMIATSTVRVAPFCRPSNWAILRRDYCLLCCRWSGNPSNDNVWQVFQMRAFSKVLAGSNYLFNYWLSGVNVSVCFEPATS